MLRFDCKIPACQSEGVLTLFMLPIAGEMLLKHKSHNSMRGWSGGKEQAHQMNGQEHEGHLTGMDMLRKSIQTDHKYVIMFNINFCNLFSLQVDRRIYL